MSDRPTHCTLCGCPIVQPAGRGRPRRYCGSTCQNKARRAEVALRQNAARVDRRDKRVARWLKLCGL